MANNELAAKLARRQELCAEHAPPPKPKGAGGELARMLSKRAELAEPAPVLPTQAMEDRRASGRAFNPATEFSEFSRKEITEYTAAFRTYDVDKSGTLNIEELKRMMEKLGHPQTHTALCAMMREVDQDHDGEISQREFFSIFRRARDGSLQNCQGLQEMATSLSCIDVSEVGVGGAKSFFEAKANELKRSKEAEDEVKAEQAARKESMLAEVQRKTDFKDRLNKFNKGGA